MSFFINRNGTWTQISEASGTSQKLFVRASGAWQRVQQIYVQQNGTWRTVYRRVPAAPGAVSWSAPTSITGTTYTGTATWSSAGDGNASLPLSITFYQDGSPVETRTNVTSPQSRVFTISGTSDTTYAVVYAVNGSTNGAQASSNAVVTDRAVPTITSVILTPDYAADTITCSWVATNAPAGATYGVQWSDDYAHAGGEGLGILTTTSRVLYKTANPYPGHGYDLVNAVAETIDVNFVFTVFMYQADGTTPVLHPSTGNHVTGSASAQYIVNLAGGGT